MNDINLKKISKIISKHTKVQEESVNLDTSAQNTERWDSLAHIRIILEIEKISKKKVPSSKVGDLNSIKAISNFLDS